MSVIQSYLEAESVNPQTQSRVATVVATTPVLISHVAVAVADARLVTILQQFFCVDEHELSHCEPSERFEVQTPR